MSDAPKFTSATLPAMLFGFDESETPAILYHYTSLTALLEMVEFERMRATHGRYLNDASELSAVWSFIEKRIEERIKTSLSSTDRLTSVLAAIKDRRITNEFVASFSEKDDDLSQWRSYCQSGTGVSLGFTREALDTAWVSDPEGGKSLWVSGQLLKVRYLEQLNATQLDPVIDKALRLAASLEGQEGFSKQILQYEDTVRAALSLVAPSYKHAAFSNECEWRMVINKPHKPMPGQRFRTGKSSLIPYVEVDLNRDLKFEQRKGYMISRVVIGPTPNPSLAVESMRKFFAAKGHSEVVVESSTIPYRDW